MIDKNTGKILRSIELLHVEAVGFRDLPAADLKAVGGKLFHANYLEDVIVIIDIDTGAKIDKKFRSMPENLKLVKRFW